MEILKKIWHGIKTAGITIGRFFKNTLYLFRHKPSYFILFDLRTLDKKLALNLSRSDAEIFISEIFVKE